MIAFQLRNLLFILMLIISCKSIIERDMFHKLLIQPPPKREVIKFQPWTLSLPLQQCRTVAAGFRMTVFRRPLAGIVHFQIFRANHLCCHPFVQICSNKQKEMWHLVTSGNQIIKQEEIETG